MFRPRRSHHRAAARAWLLVNVLFVTVNGPLMLSIAPPFDGRVAAERAAADAALALVVVNGAAEPRAAGRLVAGEVGRSDGERALRLSIAPPSCGRIRVEACSRC